MVGKKNIEHIGLVNEKGFIIADSAAKNIGIDLSARKYTKDTLSKNEPQISETITSKVTGKQVVVFTHPVISEGNSEIRGFITTPINADSMATYLSKIKLEGTKSSYGYLVDEKGIMIYHPTVNESVRNMTSSSERLLEFLEKDVTTDYDKFIKVSEQYDLDAASVSQMMSKINNSAEDLTSTMENIAKAVTEVATTVNEGAKGVTDIAIKTSDIVSLTEAVEETSKESIAYADILREIVARFKT